MKPINILLVEDDQVDVTEIRRSLDKLNILYQLHIAGNAEAAIKMLENKGAFGHKGLPDVLLTDLDLPNMSGLELLEVIRNHAAWKHLKCFIVTTTNEKVDRKAAEKLGVSGFIIKPLKLKSPSSIDAFNLMIDLMNFKSSE
jgi:CheY-like chemotaxis protein